MRRLACISNARSASRVLSVVALAWFVPSSGRAADAVRFEITWNEIQAEVRPRQGTWTVAKAIKLTLEEGGAVSEQYSVTTSRGLTGSLSNTGKFGQASKYSAAWRVENSNTLVRTWIKAQHTETMRVVADGKNCSATLSYKLKPGFREYMMIAVRDKQPLYFIAVSAKDIRCRAKDE